jgi:hypothetical protein
VDSHREISEVRLLIEGTFFVHFKLLDHLLRDLQLKVHILISAMIKAFFSLKDFKSSIPRTVALAIFLFSLERVNLKLQGCIQVLEFFNLSLESGYLG